METVVPVRTDHGEPVARVLLNMHMENVDFSLFYVRYSTLLHLPPLRIHCVGGCWDRTQDSCDYGIGYQTL